MNTPKTSEHEAPALDAGTRPIPDWPVSYRIRRAIDLAGLEVDEVAGELGVTANSVYNYISGRSTPRRAALKVIAELSGLPLWWLEGGDVPPTSGGLGQLQDRRARTRREQVITASRCIHAPLRAA